jgi:hypothetical protein
VITEVEDLDDAGIGDRRCSARFVEEPLDDLLIDRHGGQERLDRRAAPKQHVLAEEHHAHATRADLANDPVLTDVAGSCHSNVVAAIQAIA